MQAPRMALVEQRFNPQQLIDVGAAVRDELTSLHLEDRVRPGDTIAVTAGSRGIANIDTVTRTVVTELVKLGAAPFIFPAMGSHGGATAEGQRKVLAGLGITEETMGCPIRSDMEPVCLGEADLGYPVYVDRNAAAADHIVVVNRVKPHTKFEGPLESGLMKMMAIGMGKQVGAHHYHRAAVRLSFQKIIDTVGIEVMRRCPILFGLATVENAYHQTCMVRALHPDQIPEGERALLQIAYERMARIPFSDIDVLIVDLIGKDISGTGMDTNVTGRNRDILGEFSGGPRVLRVYVRDLSASSEGNATGIGLADFTTNRLVQKMDTRKTWMNVITGISPEKAAIPIHFETDRENLDACFATIGDVAPADAKVVHIRDTLRLDRLSVSDAYASDLARLTAIDRITEWKDMEFDEHGNLVDPFGQPG